VSSQPKVSSDWRPIVRELRAAGFELEWRGRGQHVAVLRDGKRVFTMPATCKRGEHRTIVNTRAQLRRLGLIA
jgi:hypothetical protein